MMFQSNDVQDPCVFNSYGYGATIFHMNELGGGMTKESVGNAYNVQPVISLIPNIKISSGKGTSDNPFVVDISA